MLHFARTYPRQSFWMLLALILAGDSGGDGPAAPIFARPADRQPAVTQAIQGHGVGDLVYELLAADTIKLNKALRQQVCNKAARRGIQKPLLALLTIAGLYGALIYSKMVLPNVMILILPLARLLNQAGKVQCQ